MWTDIYIGETGRSLGERTLEHQKSIDIGDCKSALSQHQEQTGHRVNNTNPLTKKIKVIAKEPINRNRKIVEAIQIHLRKATLNRTDGYQLPDAYFPILREEDAKRGGGTDTTCNPQSQHRERCDFSLLTKLDC